ncbi:LysM peptidoglycan-binding domain-containing protein [Bacillus sp. BGMRC 2118]|nr:LysM peptidoglycan-binding domain-containing protein [Bacillus sp. BGMRC 2118]
MKQKTNQLRRILIALVILLVSVSTSLTAHAATKVLPTAGVFVNGKAVDGVQPIKLNGEVYIPFNRLAKMLHYNTIEYNPKNATFQVTDGSSMLRATVGGAIARKGNEYIHIDPLVWHKKSAYISLSAGSALFNVYMYYKPENGSIQVQKPAKQYIVQHGDSLYDIARAHHTTVYQIKLANNLKTNTIHPGQRLQIPTKVTAKETEPIREKAPVKKSTNITTVRTNIIAEAKKYIGAGYKYGATLAEAPRLFDCSSYTLLVFQKNGVNLPRTSREQASRGTYVQKLQQGDLLFFTDPSTYSDGRVGHVGIYMADGSMIHASSSKGVTITKNVLQNPYWGKHYLFAKRVVK